MSKQSYDQIATVYATDMGQSMAFDDIGYYRELCAARGGAVLELGCGTGRILLPLAAAGIDIEGIDQSDGMLQELQRQAAARGLGVRAALGTLQEFHVTRRFNTILCPYSVVTYLVTEAELARCLQLIRQALLPQGLLVLDTFIPRDVVAFEDFRLDYRRPHGDGTLQREKRISRQDGCNRIERRYTLLRADGSVERSWLTCDVIRPWTEAELVAAAAAAGFQCQRVVYDFGQRKQADPQFVALHLSP